jgi:hypothetical protein
MKTPGPMAEAKLWQQFIHWTLNGVVRSENHPRLSRRLTLRLSPDELEWIKEASTLFDDVVDLRRDQVDGHRAGTMLALSFAVRLIASLDAPHEHLAAPIRYLIRLTDILGELELGDTHPLIAPEARPGHRRADADNPTKAWFKILCAMAADGLLASGSKRSEATKWVWRESHVVHHHLFGPRRKFTETTIGDWRDELTARIRSRKFSSAREQILARKLAEAKGAGDARAFAKSALATVRELI